MNTATIHLPPATVRVIEKHLGLIDMLIEDMGALEK